MDVRASLLKAHRVIAQALGEKLIFIYNRDYDQFSGMLTYRLKDPIDGGIRTRIGLFSESNLGITGNDIVVYLSAMGELGHIRHQLVNGVLTTRAEGLLSIFELTQSMKEMNVLIKFINDNDTLPVDFVGTIPPLPEGEDAWMDESGNYILDERYGLILTE